MSRRKKIKKSRAVRGRQAMKRRTMVMDRAQLGQLEEWLCPSMFKRSLHINGHKKKMLDD
jgi:hypothetical protein